MPDAVLQGDLRVVRLLSLIQLADSESFHGVLSLPNDGHVDFEAGYVVGASSGNVRGIAALRDLSFVEEGTFSYTPDTSVAGDPLGEATGLVLDACRAQDEWTRLAPKVLSRTEEALPEGLPTAVFGICELLDGTRAVAEALVQADVTRGEVIVSLARLAGSGHLVETADPRPEAVEAAMALSGTVDYDELLYRGRTFRREGELDKAEAAFLAALRLRPDDVIARQNLKRVRSQRENPMGDPVNAWLRRRDR